MQRSRSNLVLRPALGLLCLVVACGGSSQGASTPAPDRSAKAGAPRIETLEQVDTSDLTDAEKSLWADLANDQLSPCGDPVSVAKCVATHNKCGACVTAARYLARMVTEGYDRQTVVDQYQGRFAKDRTVQLSLADAPSRGAPMAKVTLVEFSDFQCPHCGAAHPELVQLLRTFDGSVRLVYKYFPLTGHPRAMPAARAAEAARLQGKFWEMHDLLFEHQSSLNDDDLTKYAQQLGLDLTRFAADMSSEAVQKRLDASKAEGQKLGVEATPSFYVNGRQFRESPRALVAYVREELDL
ncbi:MAG TPA: thioredoxin domain-containing protein [Polyangiales bacterium]